MNLREISCVRVCVRVDNTFNIASNKTRAQRTSSRSPGSKTQILSKKDVYCTCHPNQIQYLDDYIIIQCSRSSRIIAATKFRQQV
jgi:hypothetical protein